MARGLAAAARPRQAPRHGGDAHPPPLGAGPGRRCRRPARGSYAASHGFGAAFEHKVAAEFGALMARFDPRRDFLRAAEGERRFIGSIAVDGGDPDAVQLRFFILDPALRGHGLGRRWLGEAVAHARGAGFRRMFLWTLGGLDAATALYEEAGFVLEEEGTASQFGTPTLERRFGLALP